MGGKLHQALCWARCLGAEPIPHFSLFPRCCFPLPTAPSSVSWQMGPCPLVFILLDAWWNEPGKGTAWKFLFCAAPHLKSQLKSLKWGWDDNRTRPTSCSDAPSETSFTSQSEFSRWKVIFLIPRIPFYCVQMYDTHESDLQPHSSLDQQQGPRGADVCSDRGTCPVLGGSSAPT